MDTTPKGLRARGKTFWQAVTTDLEMEAHELSLLEESCRTLDRVDALEAEITQRGLLLPDGRVQPAVIEQRQQRVVLARLVASLRLPDEYRAEVLERGQRRGAARGPYKLREVSSA